MIRLHGEFVTGTGNLKLNGLLSGSDADDFAHIAVKVSHNANARVQEKSSLSVETGGEAAFRGGQRPLPVAPALRVGEVRCHPSADHQT